MQKCLRGFRKKTSIKTTGNRNDCRGYINTNILNRRHIRKWECLIGKYNRVYGRRRFQNNV